ncbi:nucleotidyltransferase domain-containing protein [Phenylobacterium terrae]|uniref:Nucleotidyltransferase domain-containing protein n=1 Tax=Phenylobacterium terrae TaxID=2665495 RepID=A0ABW4N6R2_9CAUL
MAAVGLDRSTWSRIVARLRATEPKLQAVVLCGSHACGEASPDSDIDIMALTDGAPQRSDRTWFEIDADGHLIHVSVGTESLDGFQEAEDEPALCALGFPVDDVMQVLWATPEGRRVLGEDPSERLPPGSPSLGTLWSSI